MREAKEDVQDGGNDAKTEQDSELKHGTEDVISHSSSFRQPTFGLQSRFPKLEIRKFRHTAASFGLERFNGWSIGTS